MGAAYLCGITDMERETIENNAAYIKSWIRTFKDDPKVLVLAAAQAQKSVDYILAHQADPGAVNSENQTEYETEGAPTGALTV